MLKKKYNLDDGFDKYIDLEFFSMAFLRLCSAMVTLSAIHGYRTAKNAEKLCHSSSKFSYLGVQECVSTAKNAFFGFIYGNSNKEELSAVELPKEDSEYDAPRMVI